MKLVFLRGGPEEIRTPDLRLAKALLYQLSYGPYHKSYITCFFHVVNALNALPKLKLSLHRLRKYLLNLSPRTMYSNLITAGLSFILIPAELPHLIAMTNLLK